VWADDAIDSPRARVLMSISPAMYGCAQAEVVQGCSAMQKAAAYGAGSPLVPIVPVSSLVDVERGEADVERCR